MKDIDLVKLKAHIARRKNMPEYGPDTCVERIRTINATKDSFTTDVVETLIEQLEAVEAELKRRDDAVPVGFIHNFTPFVDGRGKIFAEENRHYGRKVYAATAAVLPPEVTSETICDIAGLEWVRNLDAEECQCCAEVYNQALADTKALGCQPAVELTVWLGEMPESNGKSNFTAILHRKGQCISDGITIDRSEYPDRVRYEADRVRYLIGEISEEPDILTYDADKHSGYVPPIITDTTG